MHNGTFKYLRFSIIVLFFNTIILNSNAQKLTRQQYIDNYAEYAIREMREFHIPASITLAQACLESGDGNSILATEANNHFGIKCNSSWSGPYIRQDDDARNECFRKYKTVIESFKDHSQFLTGSARYQFLFTYNITDYKNWAIGLKRAGYATNPNYPERLIKIIEDFQLYKLDEYYKGTNIPKKFEVAYNARGKGKGKLDRFTINPYQYRDVQRRNSVRFFYSKEGDSYERIASEFSLKEWEIYKYNDAQIGDQPVAGSIIYLQNKRNFAPRGNSTHLMKEGETLWSVAQWYGVKLNALYRKNRLAPGTEPKAGQTISLRRRLRR